jgi:hypothetical protein
MSPILLHITQIYDPNGGSEYPEWVGRGREEKIVKRGERK